MVTELSGWQALALWSDVAAEKAAVWSEHYLAQAFHQAGGAAGSESGYMGVLASASLGRTSTAAYLMASVVNHWMVSPGEFHSLDEPDNLRQRSFLRNSAILLAASRLGRVDVLSELALKRLFSYQHKCGGFFDMDPNQGHGLVEAFTTAWGGRVALRLACYEQARRAAHLLADVIYMQPDPDGRFYFCYDTSNNAVATRWHVGEPQARYVDFRDTRGETHQVGMTLSLLAEMHLAEPAAGWEKPLLSCLQMVGQWTPSLLDLPAMATVAEGLALAAWALGKSGGMALTLLAASVSRLTEVLSPSGAFLAWDSGVGADYSRAYSSAETIGWMAIGLASLSQALLNLGSY